MGDVDGGDAELGLQVARLEPLPDGATRLRWSNAGHPPPVLLTPDGAAGPRARLLWADHADPMLGLVEQGIDDLARVESEVVAPAGSVLQLFTDGLVERRGESLTDGLERLCAAMDELGSQGDNLDVLCDELLSRMLHLANEDDIALVAVRL
ncbi:MAG: yegE [Nocardioides sp.]|nr:yegE [Nocardioides sp.]